MVLLLMLEALLLGRVWIPRRITEEQLDELLNRHDKAGLDVPIYLPVGRMF